MIGQNVLLQRMPVPVAVLDAELRFVDYSNQWLSHFQIESIAIGDAFFDVMPDLPEEIQLDFTYASDGLDNRTDMARFVDDNGDVIWYEWNINSFHDGLEDTSGFIIKLEDITEKKRNEDLLERSQDVARIGGWVVDLVHNTIFWSRVTRQIHEVPHEYIPNLEEGINFYKAGHSRDTITNLVNKAIEKGEPWDTELQLVTFQGKELWVRAKGEPEFIDGRCVRLSGTFQDIDQRKQAELEYRRVSERLKLASSSVGLGIWEYDLDDDSLIWDQNMYGLHGIEEGDFGGDFEAWMRLIHPEDVERCRMEIEKAILGIETFNTVFRVQHPAQGSKWLKVNSVVLRDDIGKPVKMIGVHEDVTNLRTAEAKLLRSEESLKKALDNSLIGMARVSKEGHFTQVNDSMCRMFGYTREEFGALSFEKVTYEKDLIRDREHFQKMVGGVLDTYQTEKRYKAKDGKLLHALVSVTAVREVEENFSNFIVQVIDMTSRIEAENNLKRLYELTTGQNNSLMNFAHIVSHNLRSHATNLTMITDLLLNNELNESDNHEALQMLRRAAHGLNETIVHLNEIVHVNINAPRKMRRINLKKAIKKILVDLDALIKESGTEISMDIPADHLVKGVAAYVDSIFLNLISNAIKYRDPSKKVNRIRMTAENDKQGFIIVTVEDNGLGIDMKRHGKKLFGMYKTFHKHEDAKGIGLFITKNQIESMGGSITVESAVNEGSKFRVKLQNSK